MHFSSPLEPCSPGRRPMMSNGQSGTISNNRSGLRAEHCLPQRTRVATELTLPKGVADHHGSAGTRLHFFNCERAANQRVNGKDAEELGTHAGNSGVLACG